MTDAMLVGRWTDSSESVFQKIDIAYGRDIFRYYTDRENFDLLAKLEEYKVNDSSSIEMLNFPLETKGIEKFIYIPRFFDANTVIVIKDSIYVNPAYFKQGNFRSSLHNIIEESFERLEGKYDSSQPKLVNINSKRRFKKLSDRDINNFFMKAYMKENEKSIQKLQKSTEEIKQLNSRIKTDLFLNN
jgi:hypothetical protein